MAVGRISVVRGRPVCIVEQPTLMKQPRHQRPTMTLEMSVELWSSVSNRTPQPTGSITRNSCVVAANTNKPSVKVQGPQPSDAREPGLWHGARCRLVDQDSRTSENILPSRRIGPISPSDPYSFPHPALKSHRPFQLYHEPPVRLTYICFRQNGGSYGLDLPRLPATLIGIYLMCRPRRICGMEMCTVAVLVPGLGPFLRAGRTAYDPRKEKAGDVFISP